MSAIAPTRAPSWLPALLPVLALVVLLPAFLHGDSCGHDMSFHLESWLEAARQFRQGTLYPAWATAPAFNAGEPRFLFYPPLSWFGGAALIAALPAAVVTKVYVWLALSASALSMFFVARRFTTPAAAFVVAALYVANPYMLFTGLERSAFAELLAAAWIPWLLAAALRPRPRAIDIAWPLALLWLTNAPAAVMGSYTLLILGAARLVGMLRRRERPWPLLASYTGGTGLGLAMTAVYLLPAAYERRFVQITMAIVPGLSVPQNFLFGHTSDPGHDRVNHQASWIAVALLVAAAVAIVAALRGKASSDPELAPASGTNLAALIAVAVVIGCLLFHPSQPIWLHLPELQFLQFPWRWLMVLAPAVALTLAMALRGLRSAPLAMPLAFAAVLALAFSLSPNYLYACDKDETPAAIARLFATSHGTLATDEYTPVTADNDVIRFDEPGYWLSPDPAAFAPGTIPNPNATQPDVDFGDPPVNATLSHPAPRHFELDAPQAEYLILNLRDYPNWVVADGSVLGMDIWHPRHVQRDDGLLCVPISAGHNSIDITWQTGWDRELGAAISLTALAVFGFCIYRSRRIVH